MLAHGRQIDGMNRPRQRLASIGGCLGGIAKPQHDHVLVPHERSPTLEIRHKLRTPSGDEGKLHRSGLTRGLSLGLIEVGVSVKEQQAVTTPPSERERTAQEDAAIAAEHDRNELSASREAWSRKRWGLSMPVSGSIAGSKLGVGKRRPTRAPTRSASPALSSASGSASTPSARNP